MPDDYEALAAEVSFLSAQVNRINIQQAPAFEAGFTNATMNGGVTTTLTAAITSLTATTITVTSGTSFSNPSSAGIDYFLIDNEVFGVLGGGGTTTLTVARGQLNTVAATHANGAIVDNSLYPIAIRTTLNRLPRMMMFHTTFVEGAGAYIGVCEGTHLFPDSANNNRPNDIYNFAILESGVAIAPAAGNITTLSAAITSLAATSISVTSGTNIVNGQYIQVGGLSGEIMKVVSGGGTTTLTVLRAQFTTKAATAANGAGVANSPTGYCLYFLIGGNGYRAWVTANTQYIYLLCQQVGSGLAAQANITFNIFA